MSTDILTTGHRLDRGKQVSWGRVGYLATCECGAKFYAPNRSEAKEAWRVHLVTR